MCCIFFFFKQKTAYEMRISDWSSDVCSSDLVSQRGRLQRPAKIARMYDHKALRQRHIGQWVEREALGIKELTVRQADLGIERVERHNVAHPVLAGGRERGALECAPARSRPEDRKSTRLNSSH